MTLGPYGDLVRYVAGSVRLSWYPSAIMGWRGGVRISSHWHLWLGGGLDRAEELALERRARLDPLWNARRRRRWMIRAGNRGRPPTCQSGAGSDETPAREPVKQV